MKTYQVFQWLLVVAFVVTATACSQNASEEAEAVVPQNSTAVTSDAETEGKANARNYVQTVAIAAEFYQGEIRVDGRGCVPAPEGICVDSRTPVDLVLIERDDIPCPCPLIAIGFDPRTDPRFGLDIGLLFPQNEGLMGLQFYQQQEFLNTEVLLLKKNLVLNSEIVRTLGFSGNTVPAGEYPVFFDEETGTYNVNVPVKQLRQ